MCSRPCQQSSTDPRWEQCNPAKCGPGRVSQRPDPLGERTSYQFPAGITFHCLRLAVASKVVRAAALVAGGYSIATVPTAITSTIASSRSHAAATGARSARVGAVTLRGRDPQKSELAVWKESREQENSQQGDRVGCNCNSGRWRRHRSIAGLGSPPGRGPARGSGSTAWLINGQQQSDSAVEEKWILLSAVRGRGQALDSCPITR